MIVAVARVAARAISSRRVSGWALAVIIPPGVHHSSVVRSREHNLPSVGKSKRETRNSPQLLRCNHEVDGTWYANPLARGKACGFQPLFVFRFAITCSRPSAHEHVQREQCADRKS